MQSAAMLIVIGILAFAVIGGLSAISGHYALDGIKSRTVGDGQYGTARMATKKEILETYKCVKFEAESWALVAKMRKLAKRLCQVRAWV